MHKQIKASLLTLADEKHSLFVRKLIPTSTLPILGVRMGPMRELAKQAAKNDWRTYHATAPTPKSFEELMVQALSLGYLPKQTELDDQLAAIANIVPKLDNWSLIDSCACTYKFAQRHRERVWLWLQDYILSPDEYQARFGVVMLLFHFTKEANYASSIAKLLPQIISGPYYTDMAVAWCLCELYVHHPDSAVPLLKNGALAAVTQKMARQKIRDSYRCKLD